VQVVVAGWTQVAARARSTARRAAAIGADVTVLDLDGSYRPVGDEDVLRAEALDVEPAEMRRAVARRGAPATATSLVPALVRRAAVAPDAAVVVAAPGVLLLAPPEALLAGARETGLAVLARDPGPTASDGRHPDLADLAELGAYADGLLAVRADAPVLDRWAALDPAEPRRLDVLVAGQPHTTLRGPAALVGAWSLRPEHAVEGAPLTLDGAPVVAVDLSAVDADEPWLLDGRFEAPRARLSEHPVLAALVAAEVAAWATEPPAAGDWDPERTGFGVPLDATLRRAARDADADAPDLLDPAQGQAARDWLVAAAPDGGPGPYLHVLHARPDLRATFPRVPGADVPGFLAWARTHAVDDGAPAELLLPALDAVRFPAPAAARGPRPGPGVNVVGFLGSELGIGESARLLVSALEAAGVAHSVVPVDRFAQSRATTARVTAGGGRYDTTVLCVNSDLTPTVAPTVRDLMDRSYRIGMWYWEVEDFPATQHGGFAVLDEIWVATDFVRDAIAPHSPLPVRVLTPPLPQRAEQVPDRTGLGLPDRPYLLFSFDFLSTAARKNPVGLIEAFTRAFAPDEGPMLVVKSINADRRPAQAERVRLAAAARPDVLLMEEHVSAQLRDALVAHCLAYVSLHRAEGLGLTMAEAMAWGKPVVATRYSGNLQFMTDENSFLVPWTRATVPAGAEPYPPGAAWADPDLDAAAAALRTLWDDPDEAARRGARAAQDIATRHTAAAAGAAVAGRLAELERARRTRARGSLTAPLRRTAESLGRRLLR
jgi:glycosyltransferase involved in cell wall biosynthesis